jgi:redox-sensing transcriptional repressor
MERTEGGKRVRNMDELEDYCRRHKVLMGIITVPGEYAQSVCDRLISSGIQAVWNFAPKHLDVPDGILVQSENMAASLAVLSKHLSEQVGKEKELRQKDSERA